MDAAMDGSFVDELVMLEASGFVYFFNHETIYM